MDHDNPIEYLFGKLKARTTSKEELNLLRSYFNPEHCSSDLNAYFDKVWNKKQSTAEHFDVEKNFQEIQSRLNGGEEKTAPGKSNRFIVQVVSYAAIFIMGFGLFYLYDLNKSRPLSPSNEKYVTVTIPYGSKSDIELPDGSRVTLNSGSYLKYPASFGANTRNVEFEGEAYFDIFKDKNVPFIVSTSDIHIKVLGTTFNVKSYPEDKSIETTLVTGAIEIFNEKNKKRPTKHIYLEPNQKISIPKKHASSNTKIDSLPPKPAKAATVEPTAILETNINTAHYTAWKDNKLVFDNERFSELMVKMERWYDVVIKVHSPEISQERFSGKFEKETLQQSLEALALIAPIRYTIDKKRVDIYKHP